jgi:hypothetical protein
MQGYFKLWGWVFALSSFFILFYNRSNFRFPTFSQNVPHHGEDFNDTNVVENIVNSIIENTFKENNECNFDKFPIEFHKNQMTMPVATESVHIIEPAEAEYDSYVNQISVLTFANDDLRFGWRNGVNGAVLWQHGNGSQFSLPRNHIRRERSLCIGFTERVTYAPELLYNVFKRIALKSPPYVMSFRNVLVFGAGNVMTACGYYQQLRGCINSYPKPGHELYQSINRSLSQEHLRWDDLFTNIVATTVPAASSINPLRNFYRRLHRMKPFASDPLVMTPLDKVFIIDTHWDFNYHHMLVESAARLVHYLPMLQKDASIAIHIRAEEHIRLRTERSKHDRNTATPPTLSRQMQSGDCIRSGVLGLLGISIDRVVTGHVLARQALLPQSQGCSDYVQHPLELRKLSTLLSAAAAKVNCSHLAMIQKAPPTTAYDSSSLPSQTHQFTPEYSEKDNRGGSRPIANSSRYTHLNIRIHNRPCYNNTYSWRCWDVETHIHLAAAISRGFPLAKVFTTPQQLEAVSYSIEEGDGESRNNHSRQQTPASDSSRAQAQRCIDKMSCDIQQYAITDLLIAHHGAALTNVMFMKPGSLLVEIVGYFDGKMLPVCGIFGPLAAVFGVHHYIYYYDGVNENKTGVDIDRFVKSVRGYFDSLSRDTVNS